MPLPHVPFDMMVGAAFSTANMLLVPNSEMILVLPSNQAALLQAILPEALLREQAVPHADCRLFLCSKPPKAFQAMDIVTAAEDAVECLPCIRNTESGNSAAVL